MRSWSRAIQSLRKPAWTAFGLLSVISGIALIIRPLDMESLYGLPKGVRLGQILGIRDVAIGVGLLSTPRIRCIMWARAASEVIDAVLIGIAAALSGNTWSGAWRIAVALLAAAFASKLAGDANT